MNNDVPRRRISQKEIETLEILKIKKLLDDEMLKNLDICRDSVKEFFDQNTEREDYIRLYNNFVTAVNNIRLIVELGKSIVTDLEIVDTTNEKAIKAMIKAIRNAGGDIQFEEVQDTEDSNE